jgi:hypothetical protein
MTDVGSTSAGSLGLVERVAALHHVQMFADVPGRVLAAVAEADCGRVCEGGGREAEGS